MSIIETKLTPNYRMHQNGDFRMYACECDDKEIKRNNRGTVTIKGILPQLDIGVEYIASIELNQVHPEYGASYNCISAYQDIPETPAEQRDYLATVMTELQLIEIYKVYSEDDNIVDLIKNKEFDWKKVRGFGEIVFERIYQKIIETLEYKEILSKFGKYGITYEIILKLAEELKGSRQLAIQKLEDNPYILCDYLSGWGFKRTDIVAKKMGIKHDSPHRIHTGIKYTIEENQNSGHTYMLKNDLLISACDILQLDNELIESEIQNTDGLKIIDERISLQSTYNNEYFIAKKLKEMMANNIELDFDVDKFIERIEKKHGIKLTHQQRDFFKMFKENRVGVLVGFAGSGKTAMQKFLIELLDELKLSHTVLSPSAQAAKVSTSYTGIKATTIHRKIGWGQDKKDQMLIEIQEDVIIVDEAGMEDVFIGFKKMQKIKNPKARILFVGDPFQLPSVAAGNLLHDMIESDVIPKTVLDIIFRQEEGGITDIATKIRLKEKFVPNDFKGKKLYGKDFFLNCIEQAQMEKAYKDYYDIYLKTYRPKDIMTLSPTKKGKLGTVEINKYIQSRVNPNDDKSKKEHPYGDSVLFRVEDYVINIQNMYDKCNYHDEPIEIVNGDKGELIDIIKDAEENLNSKKEGMDSEEFKKEKNKEKNKNGFLVDYTDLSKVRMDFKEIGQLLHAWCITIHKSQGDAAPAVLIIADKSHKFQLNANLIYTAITRSKQRCILLTQAETLNYAINKVENFRRKTFLQDMLKERSEIENDNEGEESA